MSILQRLFNNLPWSHLPKVCLGSRIVSSNAALNQQHVASLHTSSVKEKIMKQSDDLLKRDTDEMIARQENLFEEASRKAVDEQTFKKAILKFNQRGEVYKRGHVEFIQAAMGRMEEFGCHKDLNTYKLLLDIFPKEKMVVRTVWQTEMMHYPKQQQCAIDLLDQLEDNGLTPDDEMGRQMVAIFGKESHAFRKYQRIMYWMPKFKNINPYPVPYVLPEDPTELARLALKRMAVDVQNQVSVFQTQDLESALDLTWVASAQSPAQRRLLEEHPVDRPVFVEGGFTVWLRDKMLTHFILRTEITQTLQIYKEHEKKKEEEDLFAWKPMFGDEEPTPPVRVPTQHEQEDGTVLAMCITGTSSKDSLISWIKLLEDTNPILSQVPVVFTLRSPEQGIQIVDEDTDTKQSVQPL